MFRRIKEFLGNKIGSARLDNGVKILVVDDGPVDLKVAVRALEKEGYDVVTAVNGAEGLKKARECLPELILLDCDMPIMTGPQMCKCLKEDSQMCRIPVIFLTSIDTPKNIVDCFELDAENYLSKPISSKLLVEQIEAVLEDRASTNS